MTKDWDRDELEKHYIGKMTAKTIPINISITGKQKILDMSELQTILKSAKVLSQEDCFCRNRVRNCDKPIEGCIGIDDDAIDSIKNCDAKRITYDEALATLERTYEAGLVHMAYTFEGKEKVERICSCCSCCCHSLSAAIRFGYSDHVIRSNYIASQDSSKCVNCGVCVERCQFGARIFTDDKLVFHNEICYGCGLCVGSCPEKAIEMMERGSV